MANVLEKPLIEVPKVLDVGCGSFPRGNVNVDLRSPKYVDENRQFYLKPQHIPNLILTDAQKMPIKTEYFDRVVGHDIIEHVPHPMRLIKEMLRVCKVGGRVYIECPHRYGQATAPGSFHINWFSCSWFRQAMKKLGIHPYHYRLNIVKWKPWIPYLHFLMKPVRIGLTIVKS